MGIEEKFVQAEMKSIIAVRRKFVIHYEKDAPH
jgi:hypothetical protein